MLNMMNGFELHTDDEGFKHPHGLVVYYHVNTYLTELNSSQTFTQSE